MSWNYNEYIYSILKDKIFKKYNFRLSNISLNVIRRRDIHISVGIKQLCHAKMFCAQEYADSMFSWV